MKYTILLSAVALTISACSTTKKEPFPPQTLKEAVNADYRDADMRTRDQYRHPIETLEFFGIQPNMTVVEISPSGGWYTQILAPYLNEKGQYVAAQVPSSVNDYMKKMNDQRNTWMSAHPTLTSKTQTVDIGAGDLVTPGSADMVLTFRNVHNWMTTGGEQAMFNSFFKALKPGGILGVVEHRADPKQKRDPKAKSGYVHEKHVIEMAKKAGFKLVAKSEINANPKDTKNHPNGVWTLPPVLRADDKDKPKYMAMGESDRMTLKFVKP